METNKGPLRIITDSMYVHLGILETRHRWRQQAWLESSTQGRLVKHADLWRRLDALLCQRPKHSVVTQWTKGHARPEHVTTGLSTELDTWGNTGTDGLAEKGAKCHDIIRWPGPTADLRKINGPRPRQDHIKETKQQTFSQISKVANASVETIQNDEHSECPGEDPGEDEMWGAI